MRVVVYGLGAVGGTVAAGLAHAGVPVAGIARGAQLAALQSGPLLLESPAQRIEARIEVAADPSDLGLGPRDVILLAVKTQDSSAALERLAAAGLRDQPVYCMQNSLANEPLAARYFPDIHGINVMMPCAIAAPGHVRTFVEPRFGLFDIGCWPGGTDATDAALAAALEAGNIACAPSQDVMAWKRGKLLLNLSNVIDAAVGPDAGDRAVREAARGEAEGIYRSLGLDWRSTDAGDPRRDLIRHGTIAGAPRAGSSTAQSLARGAAQLETAWLNGEIVTMARAAGLDAPVNAALVRLGAHLAGNKAGPGAMTVGELEDWIRT
ncbi:ketopantoate reductase family protein [Mangrovicoccus algicola]|uniref:2-dehydropantoate 2-reductase n=1 Tax=Mangrovicoccus algicola TaxID=2771008 RepID=A0A8J6YWJ0_9RHOB|nr:ketopantoate reductase family protein [Mangrovicoccus algicola]MBE3638917.1 ketopantoate reductase family protein [Mangrovicoccus algicola]